MVGSGMVLVSKQSRLNISDTLVRALRVDSKLSLRKAARITAHLQRLLLVERYLGARKVTA
jgi:hypothetical protein